MRPDVKHGSSLTWDLLVARPLSACIAVSCIWWKQEKFHLKKKTLGVLFLCEAFKSFFYLVVFPPLISAPSPFVCTSYILVFLLFPPFWIRWCESKASASLRRSLADLICQRPWNVGRVTLTQSRVACRDQDLEKSCGCGETEHDRSRTFLIPAALSRV